MLEVVFVVFVMVVLVVGVVVVIIVIINVVTLSRTRWYGSNAGRRREGRQKYRSPRCHLVRVLSDVPST
jgi:hypothetical protein